MIISRWFTFQELLVEVLAENEQNGDAGRRDGAECGVSEDSDNNTTETRFSKFSLENLIEGCQVSVEHIKKTRLKSRILYSLITSIFLNFTYGLGTDLRRRGTK